MLERIFRVEVRTNFPGFHTLFVDIISRNHVWTSNIHVHMYDARICPRRWCNSIFKWKSKCFFFHRLMQKLYLTGYCITWNTTVIRQQAALWWGETARSSIEYAEDIKIFTTCDMLWFLFLVHIRFHLHYIHVYIILLKR